MRMFQQREMKIIGVFALEVFLPCSLSVPILFVEVFSVFYEAHRGSNSNKKN